MDLPVTLPDIRRAAERIAGIARVTPLVRAGGIDRDVRLKLETVQDTGAFKVRGAANAILSLPENVRARGVVTYSTGNHGRAVAHVAARLGIPATVCVSTRADAAKVTALRALDCRLVVQGPSQDAAAEIAREIAANDGGAVIDPINDPAVGAGHGTLGLELAGEWPEMDTVVVPVSGGALIAGIAVAVKALNPACRIVGVSMAHGAAMHASLAAGHPVLVEEAESLADSLQGGILLDNRFSFATVQALVDDLVLVSEEEIAQAMADAFWRHRLVLEGAAATPLAALAHRDPALFGRNVALVLTGNAVDGARLLDIARTYQPVQVPA